MLVGSVRGTTFFFAAARDILTACWGSATIVAKLGDGGKGGVSVSLFGGFAMVLVVFLEQTEIVAGLPAAHILTLVCLVHLGIDLSIHVLCLSDQSLRFGNSLATHLTLSLAPGAVRLSLSATVKVIKMLGSGVESRQRC